MRLLIFLIILSHGTFACSSSDRRLDIGDPFPAEAVKTDKKILATPDLFLRAFEVRIDDELFLACPDQNNTIAFLKPVNDDFKTPEGVRVGDIYFSILRLVPDSTRIFEGWAYILPLPSGWNAAFC